jgi:hypothetical protein
MSGPEHATWLAMWFGKDHPAAIATTQRAEAIEGTTP